jgi:hypothetical protein
MKRENVIRDIDQLSAREACTVLAALRVFQQLRAAGGNIPRVQNHPTDAYFFTAASTIAELEHFEDVDPLSDSQIDELAERIRVKWHEVAQGQ